jgi:hypothetical protein
MRQLAVLLILSAILAITVAAQKKPAIVVSPARVKSGETLLLTGSGFTQNKTAMSHLRKPNGAEYNPLRLRTNERGGIVHKIDSVMLDLGTFDVWVEDEASNTVSNRVQFTVE